MRSETIASLGRDIVHDWTAMVPAWARAAFWAEPTAVPLRFEHTSPDGSAGGTDRRDGAITVSRNLLDADMPPSRPIRGISRVVDLELPVDQCLLRRLRLPAARGAALHRALALDLARTTPLRPADTRRESSMRVSLKK